MSIDCFTTRNPSYCFVDLLTPEDAEQAMRILSGKLLRLKVTPGVPKRLIGSKRRSEQLESSRWYSSYRMGTGFYGEPTRSLASRYLVVIEEDRRFCVGGLPKPVNNHTSDLEIWNFFKDFDVEAVSEGKWPHREIDGWYAFVDLRSVAEARTAIKSLDDIDVWERKQMVHYARGSPGKVLRTIDREKRELSCVDEQKMTQIQLDWRILELIP